MLKYTDRFPLHPNKCLTSFRNFDPPIMYRKKFTGNKKGKILSHVTQKQVLRSLALLYLERRPISQGKQIVILKDNKECVAVSIDISPQSNPF